jgi:hypothetical protein
MPRVAFDKGYVSVGVDYRAKQIQVDDEMVKLQVT